MRLRRHKPPPMRSKARPRPTATRPRRHRARNDRSGQDSSNRGACKWGHVPDKLPPLSRRARVLLLASVGLIALLLVGLVDAYVNWLWFGEVGFRSVWVTVLLTRVAIFVAVALVVGRHRFSRPDAGLSLAAGPC